MIGRLEGRLELVNPGTVVIDVGGVGYLISTTLRAFQELTGRDRAALWIHTRLKDDRIDLYGFPERAELETFERLIGVAGVGPRTALAVLSSLAPAELAAAVHAGDAERLRKTPGVGTKTAQRIVLELRGRLEETAAAGPDDHRGDAISALVNLGYSERDAGRAVDGVLADQPSSDISEILRLALQRLTR
jgi:Holliday junction DNA helicase RuvA